jgi:hypothetical protein
LITLPANTPILLGGDLNLVGWRQQLDTVQNGDIVNNGTYGPDSAPDWDGTSLASPHSRHPDGRAGYSWRSDTSTFYPGLLDWILYTDSVISLKNHYILETRTMLPATLSTNGLLSDDTTSASDHAMRVADFSLSNPLAPVPDVLPSHRDARLLPNVPNPFNPATQLNFALARAGDVELTVYDARGRLVRTLAVGPREAGSHSFMWDGADQGGRPIASGVYHVQLVARMGGQTVRHVRSVVLVE